MKWCRSGMVGALRPSASRNWLVLLFAAVASAQTPVILISVDTLRADHVGAYGYRKTPTPNLDSFAEHGTVFTALDAHLPLTLPSHTSLFLSRYPFATRVEENGERVPDGAVTLAGVLRAHGYRTGAFIGSVILDRACGLDQGFDLYDSPFHAETSQGANPYQLHVRRDAALVMRAAEQWLDSNRGKPVFAFVHLFDLHTPYALPSYDAELEHVDQALGRFKQALLRGGWWDKSLIVLLADHGESLGDHGESTHGYFIYESTLHVPLIVHWPEDTRRQINSERVAAPAGLIDVAPTILDFLGLPVPGSFQGKSLLQPGPHTVVSESLYTSDAFHWAALRSIRSGDYKFIEAPKPELYNLSVDPNERTSLVQRETAKAHALQVQLDSTLSSFAGTEPHPAAPSGADSMLRSLGYLSGGTRSVSAATGPDPKDRLPEYQRYEKALGELFERRYSPAIAGFRQLLAADSKNTLARYYLGEAYLGARQPDSALHEWEAALTNESDYAPAAEAIGEVWMERQQYDQAALYFEKVVNLSPNDYSGHFHLGLARERLGDRRGAINQLRIACKIVPGLQECQRELDALDDQKK